jgi:hypothetical protein
MDNPTSTANQRTSELLTIPNQIPTDWPAAFQSARIQYIIPVDQTAILPGSDDEDPTDQSELPSWLDRLIKTPTRPSVYLGKYYLHLWNSNSIITRINQLLLLYMTSPR